MACSQLGRKILADNATWEKIEGGHVLLLRASRILEGCLPKSEKEDN